MKSFRYRVAHGKPQGHCGQNFRDRDLACGNYILTVGDNYRIQTPFHRRVLLIIID